MAVFSCGYHRATSTSSVGRVVVAPRRAALHSQRVRHGQCTAFYRVPISAESSLGIVALGLSSARHRRLAFDVLPCTTGATNLHCAPSQTFTYLRVHFEPVARPSRARTVEVLLFVCFLCPHIARSSPPPYLPSKSRNRWMPLGAIRSTRVAVSRAGARATCVPVHLSCSPCLSLSLTRSCAAARPSPGGRASARRPAPALPFAAILFNRRRPRHTTARSEVTSRVLNISFTYTGQLRARLIAFLFLSRPTHCAALSPRSAALARLLLSCSPPPRLPTLGSSFVLPRTCFLALGRSLLPILCFVLLCSSGRRVRCMHVRANFAFGF